MGTNLQSLFVLPRIVLKLSHSPSLQEKVTLANFFHILQSQVNCMVSIALFVRRNSLFTALREDRHLHSNITVFLSTPLQPYLAYKTDKFPLLHFCFSLSGDHFRVTFSYLLPLSERVCQIIRMKMCFTRRSKFHTNNAYFYFLSFYTRTRFETW